MIYLVIFFDLFIFNNFILYLILYISTIIISFFLFLDIPSIFQVPGMCQFVAEVY